MVRKKWILLAEAGPDETATTARAFADSFLPPEVVVARDGPEVLERLRHSNGFQNHQRGDPALVLLGLNLPKTDGWEVLRQIKSDARLKTIPVVMFASSREAGGVSHG